MSTRPRYFAVDPAGHPPRTLAMLYRLLFDVPAVAVGHYPGRASW